MSPFRLGVKRYFTSLWDEKSVHCYGIICTHNNIITHCYITMDVQSNVIVYCNVTMSNGQYKLYNIHKEVVLSGVISTGNVGIEITFKTAIVWNTILPHIYLTPRNHIMPLIPTQFQPLIPIYLFGPHIPTYHSYPSHTLEVLKSCNSVIPESGINGASYKAWRKMIPPILDNMISSYFMFFFMTLLASHTIVVLSCNGWCTSVMSWPNLECS